MPLFNESSLIRLFKARAYPEPSPGDVILFGLRSYLPHDLTGTDILPEVQLEPSDLDYEKVRCTIGIWKVGTGIAVYPGSTVPKGNLVEKYADNPWGKVNQMVPGYYYSYKLGDHRGSTIHRAVRQVRPVMIRRSDDGDSVFELSDPIYVDTEGFKKNGKTLAEANSLVNDNIHCGSYFNGEHLIPTTSYSSVGCQVIAGYTNGNMKSEAGPWRKFVRKLYTDENFRQNNYAYALFSPEEVAQALSSSWSSGTVEITFGSYHESVKLVQKALFDRGYYHGDIDGDFRQRSVTALLAFERAHTPGVTGRTTQVIQDLLEIKLPNAGKIKLVPMGKISASPEAVVVDPPVLPDLATDSPQEQDPVLVSLVPFTHLEESPTTLTEDPTLLARIDLLHAPLPGWSIRERGTSKRYDYFHDQQPGGISLGYQFGYPPANPTTRGLARTSSYSPKLRFEPEEWQTEFRFWPELLFPTSWAESHANFLVINAWDSAAMTFGFIQLAAHTSDDLLPFIRRLVSELPEEAKQWFPELTVINRTLCYQRGGRYKSLEEARRPNDGGPSSSWYRGDFMQFLNPSRLKTDPEELHAAARWIEWTRTSREKRKIEVDDSIRNMKDSLILLHRELLRNASSKYPKGVDGMRCDHLAAALAVPHLSPSQIGKAVWALKQSDVLDAFENLEYGPGARENSVVEGVRARGTRLSKLRYHLASDEPV